MDEDVVNEYLLDAYTLKKQQYDRLQEQLQELVERHDVLLNTLTDVCRRADRMQQAGDHLRDLIDTIITEWEREPSDELVKIIDKACQDWGDANV